MTDEAILFIIVYTILAFLMGLSEMVVMGILTKDKMFLVRPKFLYEHSEMNMFGCYLVTALCCVINPFGGLFRLVHFICTIGKKSHENLQSKIAKDDEPQSEMGEDYKTAEKIRAIAEEIMAREGNCDLLYPEYNGVGWNDLCDKGIKLFEQLKKEEKNKGPVSFDLVFGGFKQLF